MTPAFPGRGGAKDFRRTSAGLLAGIEHDAGSSGFILGPGQREAAERLAGFGAEVTHRRRARRLSPRPPKTPRSIYLHGPVGRGKTWLMDSFHGRLRVRTRRVHFHDFFRSLHRGAHAPVTQGSASAIQQSVDALLADVDVLFFDEFHVHDVGDGMFIARLLESAARQGVPLVVTSNYAPDELLPNPLWHDHFLPTIQAIKTMMDIVEVGGPTDFRRFPPAGSKPGATTGIFSSGRIITPGTESQLGRLGLFRPPTGKARVITPTTQPIVVKNSDPDLLWVSFAALCEGLTSTADFLALASVFETWVVDDVPSPGSSDPSAAAAWQRFSNAVDVLHDQDRRLFLIGEGPLDWDEAEATGAQPADLARIASRLSLLGRSEGGAVSGNEAAGS